jgi:hypothetical protein
MSPDVGFGSKHSTRKRGWIEGVHHQKRDARVFLLVQRATVYGQGDSELRRGLQKKTLISGARAYGRTSNIECLNVNALDEFLDARGEV